MAYSNNLPPLSLVQTPIQLNPKDFCQVCCCLSFQRFHLHSEVSCPIIPSRLLRPHISCPLLNLVYRLYPYLPYIDHLPFIYGPSIYPLPPTLPHDVSRPLYTGLKARSQLKFPTCRLHMPPRCSQGEFIEGLVERLCTPGLLSRANMQHAISARYESQGGDDLSIKLARLMTTTINSSDEHLK